MQEATWEVSPGNTYSANTYSDSAKGKDGTQPWWPLHLTLGLRAVVQADTREALAGRVRCHINLSQLVNWSVTSQASEATGPGASVTSNCFLPMGPRWLTLSLVRLTAPIPSGVPSGAHSALSFLHRESTRGLKRWCHQQCPQDLSFRSRAHVEKNKKQGVMVHAHKCIFSVPIGTYMHTFTHHTHMSLTNIYGPALLEL